MAIHTCSPCRPRPAPTARARAALVGARPAWAGRRRGFSLLELMVVITIITVVSGMGIVRYAASLARYRADLAARKVAGDIALAQARARATSAATQIRFSTGANAYQMPGETLGNASSPTVVSLNNPSLGATLLSVSIVGGGSNLNFDGFGQPLATATVRVGVGAETRTLTVDASTGAISIANP